MKILIRVGLGLVALAVLAIAGLWFALPAIVDGADLRGRLNAFTQESIGRTVDYGSVELGILPPRLVVAELSVSGASEGAPPALKAARAALVLAWRPLFSGQAVIDALDIESAELRMVRTADGIDLLAAAVPAAPAAAAEPSTAAPIGLHRVSLRDSRIVFDDQAVTPAVTWELEAVSLEASGTDVGEPVDAELTARLASGGDVSGSGRFDPAGATTADLAIGDFVLTPAVSYVDALDRAKGKTDVSIGLVSPVDGAPQLKVALSGEPLDIASGDTTVVGAVAIVSELMLGDATTGTFSVDLTGATVDLAGGAVHKLPGEAGTYEGELRIADDGVTIVRSHLQLRNLGADIQLRTEPALRVELSAPAFALDGWGTIVPALADSAPRGELRIERLVYTGEPERLVGVAELRKLLLDQGEGSPPLEVSGFVDATGRDVAVRQMSATLGAARLAVAGGVEDLFGTRNVTVRLNTPEPIESNNVFSLVDAMRDAVFGALALDVNLGLPLGGPTADQPALERLAGNFSFQIGGDEAGGMLKGVSLLQQVFNRFGTLGHAALLALPAKRGKPLDEYYSEQFRVAAGSFQIANGEARTNDLHIEHEKYRTNLHGGVRLTDLTLDMRGEVVIGPELDAALSGASQGRSRTIPLARVGGTVTDPTIALRDEDVSRFVAQYAFDNEKLGKKIDKALGAGASDLLRDMLGGGSK